jgi:hypothetical protein
VRALVSVILRQQFLRGPLEHPDEFGADHLSFRLRDRSRPLAAGESFRRHPHISV